MEGLHILTVCYMCQTQITSTILGGGGGGLVVFFFFLLVFVLFCVAQWYLNWVRSVTVRFNGGITLRPRLPRIDKIWDSWNFVNLYAAMIGDIVYTILLRHRHVKRYECSAVSAGFTNIGKIPLRF